MGEDEGEGGEGEAEQDELLMETAGEVIPALTHAMPAPQLVMCLQALLPAILPKLVNFCFKCQPNLFKKLLARVSSIKLPTDERARHACGPGSPRKIVALGVLVAVRWSQSSVVRLKEAENMFILL